MLWELEEEKANVWRLNQRGWVRVMARIHLIGRKYQFQVADCDRELEGYGESFVGSLEEAQSYIENKLRRNGLLD